MEASATITQNFKTKNPYEGRYGYSRAVRRGPFIFVSGTTSIDPSTGEVLHPDSAHDQARAIFAEAIRAIEALGGTRRDVCRVRMFVKEQEDGDAVGRAMKEAIREVGPAATMVFGMSFVEKEISVEIEVDAFVAS